MFNVKCGQHVYVCRVSRTLILCVMWSVARFLCDRRAQAPRKFTVLSAAEVRLFICVEDNSKSCGPTWTKFSVSIDHKKYPLGFEQSTHWGKAHGLILDPLRTLKPLLT